MATSSSDVTAAKPFNAFLNSHECIMKLNKVILSSIAVITNRVEDPKRVNECPNEALTSK